MPRSTSPVLRGLLVFTAVTAVLAGGHQAGRQVARAGLFSSGSGSGPVAPATPPSQRPTPVAVSPERWKDALEKLKRITAACPDLSLDWEASARIDEILAGLSPADLAEVFAGLNVIADQTLAQKVGACWAARDPEAALRTVLARLPGDHSLAARVFGEWADRQPGPALAWLDTPGLPPELSALRDKFCDSAAEALAVHDFEHAGEAIHKMSPTSAEYLLMSWKHRFAHDPPTKSQMIEFRKFIAYPARRETAPR